MAPTLPSVNYSEWSEICDTLHAYTQILGKLAVALAPPEPQLQHAALRLTSRGWETNPLPAPDGSGSIVALLDLHTHEAVVEHSNGLGDRFPLYPDTSVADVTKSIVAMVTSLGGDFELAMNPQEVPWDTPLDEDEDHRAYDPKVVSDYFTAATEANLILAELRAPYRGRSTPVNAWWGSFDLAVNLFSGRPAAPPSPDFIMRNAMDSQEVAIGWWPGDPRYGKAAFYAYAHPAQEGFDDGELSPAAGAWNAELTEYVLDWDVVRNATNPRETALKFARTVFTKACDLCDWDGHLAGSAHGDPPPIV